MLKLLKYEIIKTKSAKLILLALTAVAEVVFLIGLNTEESTMLSWGIAILTLLAFGGTMIAGIQSVLTLHKDMNSRQGYMLFMTPHSCYSILGAKAIECTLSIAITGLAFFALGALDIMLVFRHFGELEELLRMANQFMQMMHVEIGMNVDIIASLVYLLVCAWIGTVMTAFLADTVASALLRGKRFSGLASFVLFLVISWAAGIIMDLAGTSLEMSVLLIRGSIELAIAVVMYIGSAAIMEHWLSV